MSPRPAFVSAAAAGVVIGLLPLTTGVAAAANVVGGSLLGYSGVVVDPSPGVPALPTITATSFVVADADTGDILAAENAHERLAPASTLKVLTAVTLIPELKPTMQTTVNTDGPRTDGTKVGVVAGNKYSVDALMTAMLMMSANDAAVALADANGGIATTLDQMNAVAAHLQADDTAARTPDGLDAPGQSSSAYDLALLFRAGLAQPRFRRYLAITRTQFPAPDGKSYQIQTHDKLLVRYPGMIGGKNGYTVAAQASYVGAATRNGHTIIVAVMRDQPNFWNEVGALLDWGFAADGVAHPVGTLVGPVQHTPAPTAAPAPKVAAAGASALTRTIDTATTSARRTRGSATNLLTVVTWVAVGVGGLLFLLATILLGQRLSARRRRRHLADVDENYLRGLSRLSALGEIPDRS